MRWCRLREKGCGLPRIWRGRILPIGVLVLIAWTPRASLAANGPPRLNGTLLEQTVAAVRDCLAADPPPWPEAWQHEYLDTIRRAVTKQTETADYPERLRILRDGFALYWKDLRHREGRPYFEVRLAEIRWYVEHLMETELPTERERRQLRDQYRAIIEHAAESLLAQFSFLDPNAVGSAKVDHVAECQRHIDSPLLPIFLRPLSDQAIEEIQERWSDLRYARIDLWCQLDPEATAPGERNNEPSEERRRDHVLAEQSFAQLRPQRWALATAAPEYYRSAVTKEITGRKQQAVAISEAHRRENRLPMAVLQTEYLSFLLAALLETAGTPECSMNHSASSTGRGRREKNDEMP